MPEKPGSAFTAWLGPGLGDLLCIQQERVVANDNTIRHKRKRMQIQHDKHRFRYVEATVRVHEYPDQSLAIFHGPRRLAHYDATGALQDKKTKSA
ncbi:MAG: hypothetical protein HQK81_11655 [Desulfovibrionaceae bacterium]|nr:hypothetical protein [Desulfovibrionaceae bacterium]MBF0481902.1 hypothetical protein [Desulfovibrionaceae bacterium]MBF0514697.1 hypothetical protein [Desulfovibrionaceae bacterium]